MQNITLRQAVDWFFSSLAQNTFMWFASFCFGLLVAFIVGGLLWCIDRHAIMKPEKRKYFYGGLVFISMLCFAMVLFLCDMMTSVTKHLNAQIEDIRTSATQRENRGLEVGLFSTGLVKPTAPATNYDVADLTEQSMPLSPQNRSMQSGVDVAVILHISNAGEPTTIWNCQTYAILPGGKEIDATIPEVVVSTNQSVPTLIGMVQLNKTNFLLDALSTTPLATGASGIYWVAVHINGISEIPAGTHIYITFDDAYNRKTKVDYMWEPGQ